MLPHVSLLLNLTQPPQWVRKTQLIVAPNADNYSRWKKDIKPYPPIHLATARVGDGSLRFRRMRSGPQTMMTCPFKRSPSCSCKMAVLIIYQQINFYTCRSPIDFSSGHVLKCLTSTLTCIALGLITPAPQPALGQQHYNIDTWQNMEHIPYHVPVFFSPNSPSTTGIFYNRKSWVNFERTS